MNPIQIDQREMKIEKNKKRVIRTIQIVKAIISSDMDMEP
jgi:hypothetical protein